MSLDLSPEALKVIEKVKKLLALAHDERNNEHQAAAAAAKAVELLNAYNLDMAVIGHTAKGTQRSDNRLKGGLYQWQRDLWKAVSQLNFCMYWSIKGLKKGETYEHRILGRQENVVGAQVLADYLQQTVERLAQDEAKRRGINVFVREMIAYREGMAERLTDRLAVLRYERLEEDKRKERERKAAAHHPGATGNGVGIVLATVIEDEECMNIDFLRGFEPGTTARRRAADLVRQQAANLAWAAEMKKREEEERLWALRNPEEAAAKLERERKEEEREMKKEERNRRRRTGGYRDRQPTAAEARRGLREFNQGYDRGGDIGLDQQIRKGSPEPRRLV